MGKGLQLCNHVQRCLCIAMWQHQRMLNQIIRSHSVPSTARRWTDQGKIWHKRVHNWFTLTPNIAKPVKFEVSGPVSVEMMHRCKRNFVWKIRHIFTVASHICSLSGCHKWDNVHACMWHRLIYNKHTYDERISYGYWPTEVRFCKMLYWLG